MKKIVLCNRLDLTAAGLGKLAVIEPRVERGYD